MRGLNERIPLLTPPHLPLDATPFGRASKRGLRELGSGRLSAYMQLSCPEFRLRGLPRIPVRGQTVQGGRVLLRKAPLPSRVYPWSTRRLCGPLAFRCATEGSRSAKEGEGSQEGTGNHMVSCPLFSPPPDGGNPPVGGHRHPRAAEGGQKTLSMGHILAFCIRDAGTGEIANRCCRIEENMLARDRKILRIKQKASTESRCFFFLERLTRLELATSTLARWRSTR